MLFKLYRALEKNTLIALFMFLGFNAMARGPMSNIDANSSFIVYYGDEFYLNVQGSPDTWQLNIATLEKLSAFDVVVLQPNQPHMTPEVIAQLKERGVDYVLGYISIGEDFIDDAVESPLAGGSGMMRYDSNTGQLVATTDNNLRSFYVDVDTQTVTYVNGTVDTVTTEERLKPDGKPDYNPIFKGYMVNPNDTWRWVIDNMRIGTQDVAGRSRKAGLRQLAGMRDVTQLRNRSTNFGFDGFFLDTIDTAGPYNGAGWYPWTVDEMRDTVKFISDSYPDKIVFANRGAFYFTAGLKSPVTEEYSIDFSIRPYINAFLFESFRYDSEPGDNEVDGVTEYYNENRFNVAPKVLAEANREDGFTVFSLEYESGRSGIVDDAFEKGTEMLGFVGYLASGRELNTFDFDFINKINLMTDDLTPPTWDTTGSVAYNQPSGEPRVGVQAVETDFENGTLTVQWDIAVDRSYPITYDIEARDELTGQIFTYSNVDFKQVREWNYSPGEFSANEYVISNLPTGARYNIRVIAKDAVGNANEDDQGQSVLFSAIESVSNPLNSGAIQLDGLLNEWTSLVGFASDADDVVGVSPEGHISGSGNQANWRNIKLAHTDSTLYLAYENQTNIYISWGFQLFLDTDQNKDTGYQQGHAGLSSLPIGADYMIEGVNVYRFNPEGTTWATMWELSPASQGYQVGRIWSGNTGEVFFPLTWIGSPQKGIDFIAVGVNAFYGHPNEFDFYPDDAGSGNFFRYSLDN
ncbi:fibronectin type III domain-containing protein [Pleionea sediminis]|uniref:fibronectin type III domain-containing protein n=1 Tax=Pleionea sediminis TaxID=2569479 RepID=UPI001184E134|nr:fibronectin type III domain-containing protein [Pleionea sediminis]